MSPGALEGRGLTRLRPRTDKRIYRQDDMGLIWINEVSVSFGGPRLLDGATLQIEAGERIGLLGRNGSGKSTLMKLLMGDITPDTGEIIRSGEVRIAMLPQDVPDDLPGTVYDVVASGGREHLELLREYHDLTLQMSRSGDDGLLKKLERVQHRLETSGAWLYHQRVETVIARIDLDENAEFRLLSAGMKRRVFLARALVNDPDLLLLDEPTNHLDINTILWLEDFLLKFEKTLMFVTHDRAFLQRLATRIVEIDRGRLIVVSLRLRHDTSNAVRPCWRRKKRSGRNLTRNWPGRRPGFGKGSRPVAPGTRAGCGRWCKCVGSGHAGRSRRAMSG